MEIFDQIIQDAKYFFKNEGGSHDFDHVERVLKMCLHIGRKEKADLEILKFAAILHDIGRNEEDKNSGKIDHARYGAELAKKILENYKFSREKIKKIAHCIESHRFRGTIKPKTLEAKILFDADKLDSIGAVGIGRAFFFANEVGAKLHIDKSETEILKTKPYTKDDTAYREFMVKLRHIKDRMLTKEGRKLAKDRHAFMVEIFNRLKREGRGEM